MTILSSDMFGYVRIILGLSSNRLSLGGSTSGSGRWNLALPDFVAGAVSGEVGGWLDWLHALEMTFHMWRGPSMTFILRGRRSISWGWRVTWLGPRIGNAVSYVTQIIADIHFAWQAQYLVRLEGDFTGSTHWKWGFICDADHWWHSFCVAGTVFGEVGGWLYLLHALEMTFHMWRRSLMTFILRGRRSIWWGSRLILLAARIGNDDSYVMRIIDDIEFVWQAQYLVRLEGDFSWQAQHFVTFWEIAGARNVVFYKTKSSPRSDREGLRSGGCEMTILSSDILGLCSDYPRIILESSFYWRKHFREFLLKSWASSFHGRRNIWWGCRVTLLAPRLGNDVSYVTQIIDDIQFVAGAVFGEVGRWPLLRRANDVSK